MLNVDINVDRRTDGLMDGQKIGRLYRTLLQAGAIKMILYFFLRITFNLQKKRENEMTSFDFCLLEYMYKKITCKKYMYLYSACPQH